MSNEITTQSLIESAEKLSGASLADFFDQDTQAHWHNTAQKGRIGQLIEQLLGAQSHSKPQPDFAELGIELKTIPLNQAGKPLESTYICVAPFSRRLTPWHTSLVYQKLQKVLWVPIIGAPKTPLFERQIGVPFLWTMDENTSRILEQDWQELNELMLTGQHDLLSASQGQYLQCRPKAMNSQQTMNVALLSGDEMAVVPKGYYLRSCFTAQLIQSQYRL